MQIKISIEFGDGITAENVQNVLNGVFETARFAAMTNAEKTTVAFDGMKPKCTIKMDDEMRELLRAKN